MSFLDDFKEWSTAKKAISIIAVCCVGVIIIGVIGGGLSLDKNTSQFTFTTSGSSDDNVDTSPADNVKTYKDGIYKVGSDLPAGDYEFTQTSSADGHVETASDSSMDYDSLITNQTTKLKDGSVFVTVKDGDYIKVQGGELAPSDLD